MLIDSQADISVIKESSIHKLTSVNENEQIYIKGITDQLITSLGTTYVKIKFGEEWIVHKVHVVPDSFEIPVNGILGKDFLKLFNCSIDYASMTLTINTSDGFVVINIFEGPDKNSLVIPPRAEVIRHFKVSSKSSKTEDQVINPTEIAPGVLIARSIFNPNTPFLRVINTTNKPVTVNRNLPRTENLSFYDIYAIDEVNVNKIERSQKIAEAVSAEVPNYIKKDLIDLCQKYEDVFALKTDKMTINNFYTQKLRIRDEEPVYVKNYRLPQSHKEEINKQVNKLLQDSLIEPSCSNYNSPLILVPKPMLGGEKRWRMCVDYRLVNKKLIADKYPLPRIDEILDGLGRAKFFSVLDLFSGFHQIPLEESSRDITSFSTPEGSFRWKVLPFGLNVSPNSFSRMMSLAFAGASQVQYFLYMDDIIVIGNSVKHHLKNLQSIFEICRKKNLKLNPLKCKFFRSEVTYLGHKCTADGILPDPEKLQCVMDYPVPRDKDEVKRFVAFANYYRRFIKNFAAISRPLNVLTRKKSIFHWTRECQQAFDSLKGKLVKPPVLAYPDFTKTFTITADASKYACGAVLSQQINGIDRPIAFASKPFTQGEINKITKEQELIAIHWAVKHFRPYIYDKFFEIKSDHKSLIYLFSLKDPSSRLTRIRLDLEEHNFVIDHIKGKDNVVADALSRIHIDELKSIKVITQKILAMTTRSMTKKQDAKEIKDKKLTQVKEPKMYEVLRGTMLGKTPMLKTVVTGSRAIMNVYTTDKTKNDKKPVIEIDVSHLSSVNSSPEKFLVQLDKETSRLGIKIVSIRDEDILFSLINARKIKEVATKILKNVTIRVIPSPEKVTNREKQLELVKQFHDDLVVGGHPGQKRLRAKLCQRYAWKGIQKDIAKFVRECEKCLLNKIKIGSKEPLVITETPAKPFDKIIVDTIGPLPVSEAGNKYAVTIICDLTKYVIGIPLPNKEAITVARALVDNFILIFGLPGEFLSDLGTEYKNEVFDHLTKMLNMKQSFSTPYRHQTVGSVERNHRSFNEFLRTYLPDKQYEWDQLLRYFLFTYNTTPNSSFDFKYSPFELVYGKIPVLIDCVKSGQIDPVYNVDDYAKEVKFRLQIAHSHARELLEESKRRNKLNYDVKVKPIDLTKGQTVVLQNDGRKQKHDNTYKGPYIVDEVKKSNVIIRDLKTNALKEVHKNRLRKINK